MINKLNINLKNNMVSLQKIILISAVFILYFNSLSNEWALDDTMMITENQFTKGGWEGLKKIFTTDAFAGYLGEGKTLLPGGRYRPLSQGFFNIYYSLFGLNPLGLHIINVFLFMITVVLVFKNLRDLLGCNKEEIFTTAFIASLLYVVHPLNTEVVANIKSMDLIFSMLFSMISLHYSLSYFRTNKAIYLIPMAISFLLGILSKETSLAFFAIIPLTLILFKKYDFKKLIFSQLTLSLIVALYFILRWSILGNILNVEVLELLNDPFLNASGSEKYATIFYTWLVYIKLILFPYPLTHDYYPFVIEIKNWTNPLVWLSIIGFVLGLFFSILSIFKSIFKKEKPNTFAYGFLFFLIIFSISSNLFFNIGTFMNERFMFIADIGIFLIIAKGITILRFKYPSSKTPLSIVFIIVVLAYSAITIDRNPDWKNDFTLFRTDVLVSKNSAKCTVSAGGKTYEAALLEKNEKKRIILLSEAKQWVSKGLKIHPKYFQAWMLLGNINFELNSFSEALICYQNCLALGGGNNDILNNMRNLVIKSRENNNLQISNKAIDIMLKYNYQKVNTLYQKAFNLEKEQKIDSAIYVLKNIIKQDSAYSDAYNKMGQLIGQYKNDMEIAESYLLKAYELKPTNPSILENLGTLYAYSREMSKALYFFKASWKADPNNKQVYTNISMVYRSLGNIEEAEKWERDSEEKFGN